MLPAAHRLTDPAAFSETVRSGRRAGARCVVVHVLVPAGGQGDGAVGVPARVGLVVSKAVGDAVTRTRVKRRLRHQVAPHLSTLPPGSTVVLRALPPAAAATSAELATELARGLERCLQRAAHEPARQAAEVIR